MSPPTKLTPAALAPPPSARGGDSFERPIEAVAVAGASLAAPEAKPSMQRGVLAGLIKTVRPHQWVKNLFVIAPMVFHKDLFVTTSVGPALNLVVTGRALGAAGVFCLLAGAIYTINDLVDVSADRLHPIKRERPIASGTVPPKLAAAMAAALVAVSLVGAYAIAPALAVVALVYLLKDFLYSFWAKKVAFLDVGLIAMGFVLRVTAGGIATDVRVSGYMLACTALLALFLGFGKRRHEFAMENAARQRRVLKAYSARSLNLALVVTGSATLLTYLAYTLDPSTKAYFNSNYLWLTVPFTAVGVARFLMLVSGRAGRGIRAESPTQEMLHDVLFMLNLFVWVAVVVAVVYKLRPHA